MGKKHSTRFKYALATSIALGMALSYQGQAQAVEPANSTSSEVPVQSTVPAVASKEETSPVLPQVPAESVSPESASQTPQTEPTPEASQTSPAPQAPAEEENVVLGASITYQSAPGQNAETANKMLNGTKNGLSDKYFTPKSQARVEIKLNRPRTIVRLVVEHAGAGGEDSEMNTRDFDLIFRDMKSRGWKLAKAIRGNEESVTDVLLERPFESDEWGLVVKTATNGNKHPGVRIYNWKMYEKANPETPALDPSQVTLHALGEGYVQLGLKNLPQHSTVTVYDNAKVRKIVATGIADQGGNLLLKPLALKNDIKTLYYRIQTPGLAQSAVGQLDVPKNAHLAISQMTLEVDKAKRIYRVGEELDFSNTSLLVRYVGDFAGKVYDLTNPAVTVSGFNSQKIGQQDLEISFLGHKVRLPWKVFVYKPAPDNSRVVVGMDVVTLPKAEYIQGEDLDLIGGRFRLLYSDGRAVLQPFVHRRVVYSGYDKNKLGTQRITMTFKNEVLSHFDVVVKPKEQLDLTRLKALVAEAEAVIQTGHYQYATLGARVAVDMALARAKEALNSPFTRSNEEEGARWSLYGELRRLNGTANKDKVLNDFKALINRGENLMSRFPTSTLYPSIQKAVNAAKALLPLEVIPAREIESLSRQMKDLFAWF